METVLLRSEPLLTKEHPLHPHSPQLSPHFITYRSFPPLEAEVLCLHFLSGPRHGEPQGPTHSPPAHTGPTSAHGPILSQGIARRAGTHIGTLSVVAAEGAEQGIQGALVNVWGGQWRCRLGGVCLQDPLSLSQASPPHPYHTAQVWAGRVVPSQVIMGPGSKPSAQAHSKPPMILVQVPSPQGCPTEHSSVSGVGVRGWSEPAEGSHP